MEKLVEGRAGKEWLFRWRRGEQPLYQSGTYEAASRRAVAENVASGEQSLREAKKTGGVIGQSTLERMKAHNKTIQKANGDREKVRQPLDKRGYV